VARRARPLLLRLLATGALAVLGCSGHGGAAGASGGATGAGGITGSGGAIATGGGTASGGHFGAGGTKGSGGRAASGGNGSGGSDSGGITGAGGGLGPIPGLDTGPPSHGATITFSGIGAAGWMPSRRDPASGMCDAYSTDSCCMAKMNITGDQMTPWDEDLIMTLRGPMLVAQLAVYQPSTSSSMPTTDWQLRARWDGPSATRSGIAFDGKATSAGNFAGTVGSQCLVNVSTDQAFPCGAGSSPYCPTGSGKYYGWAGSKMFVVLASMPHAGTDALPATQSCSTDTANGWYDAPWIGLSHGELVRAGAFQACQCYDKMPGSLKGDGCGQINAFEVVNDNNSSKNLELFSTNFFGYQGYIGEGPCGTACNVSALDPAVDLVNKKTSQEAAAGALSSPGSGPGAAFRRPAAGYRYFVVLMNASARTVQMAMVSPSNVPASLAGFLPALPAAVPQATVDAVMQLRLPH